MMEQGQILRKGEKESCQFFLRPVAAAAAKVLCQLADVFFGT